MLQEYCFWYKLKFMLLPKVVEISLVDCHVAKMG